VSLALALALLLRLLLSSMCLGTVVGVPRPPRQAEINLDTHPTEKAEIAKLHPVFPRLAPDSPAACPLSMVDIKRYVTAGDGQKGP
jgi:hypothetical protein